MAWGWFTALGVVASIASILGLWFSIYAWRRARGAEKAAREARDSIRESNAAEDLEFLSAVAKDFLACVQNGQIEAACSKCRDLLAGVSKARLRWQPILPSESADRMGKTVKRVRDISSNLSEPGRQLSPEERRKLLDFAHNVVIDLAEEAGRMLSELERRK